MHMPGHKRNTAFLPILNPVTVDITEIDGFDNLHSADGILRDAMERARVLWGAKTSHFLVNGSSAGILAAISATVPPGKADSGIAIDRSAHKSAYHAMELRGLTPYYLCRPVVENMGIHGSLSPHEVVRVLDAHPNIQAVFVTSPTYEGVVSDIAAIAKAAHDRGALLIVDEAHGAHLGFSPAFLQSAVTQGADIVIQSLHKTLPAFTQSAILHICSDRVDSAQVAKFLSYYQTTSPSYLLMAGMDACVGLLTERGKELFAAYENRLHIFRQRVAGLSHIRLLSSADESVWAHDPGKLYFSLRGTNLTGETFGGILREEFHIEPEMTTADGCLCMTSIADTDEGFERLARAVMKIDSRLPDSAVPSVPALSTLPDLPHRVCTPAQAAEQDTESVALSHAMGRIAGEFVWAYPPDIPLLVPGERIDARLIEYLTAVQEHGVRLHSDSEGLPHRVRVLGS